MSKKINLNLNHKNNARLTEDMSTDFSNDVYFLMQSLYDGRAPDIKVSMAGNQGQIMSFFTALQREKRYMDSFMRHGLDDAQTKHSHYELEDAVREFEFETGLTWPFTQ